MRSGSEDDEVEVGRYRWVGDGEIICEKVNGPVRARGASRPLALATCHWHFRGGGAPGTVPPPFSLFKLVGTKNSEYLQPK